MSGIGDEARRSRVVACEERLVFTPPQLLFRVLSMIGGRFGYFGAERLVDAYRGMTGTAGRGRVENAAEPVSLQVGMRIDGWIVRACEPGRLLELSDGEGAGVLRLRWDIASRPGGRSLLKQTVLREGAGGVRRLLVPADLIVWHRVFLGLCERAELQGAGASLGRPTGSLRLLKRATIVPRGLEETFSFFADAANLQQLTPPWVNFSIVTPLPIAMERGTLIDYRIRIHGVPVKWRTQITCWEPPHRFVDQQLKGPYRWWHHEHRFEQCEQGTRVIDEVEYAAALGWITEPLFVSGDVDRIFSFREHALHAALGGHSAARVDGNAFQPG